MQRHTGPDSRPSRRRRRAAPGLLAAVLVAVVAALTGACGSGGSGDDGAGRPTVVVTYPVLGSVVRELLDGVADVQVLMGDGVDPHDWSPSARDVEAVHRADLVVVNGLGLEEGLAETLDEAASDGVAVFRATDHVQVRLIGGGDAPVADPAAAHGGGHTVATDDGRDDEGHGDAAGDGEHAPVDGDPHFWVDPLSMTSVVQALADEFAARTGIDVSGRRDTVVAGLTDLHQQVGALVATLAPERRELVTGHESLGYFADRYGFTLIGAVVPGASSQAETSAAELADLARTVREAGVTVVFTEEGTSASVAAAVARQTGATLVELPSHRLPGDGRYATFVTAVAERIVTALRT